MNVKSIAFTICANNYLAHASVLAKSFKKFNPGSDFLIAVVDVSSDLVNYDSLGADFVEIIDHERIEGFKELAEKYRIAELCTVVKPELILQLFDRDYESVMYIDPDIQVFGRFTEITVGLEEHSMILTPHMLSPTADNIKLIDRNTLRTGVFNLGFIALKKAKHIIEFVKWWDKRVRSFGNVDPKQGHFYDQIWLNAAPAFIPDLLVLHHLGYNMANWNLHERSIKKNGVAYWVNDKVIELKFFHFSHFKPEKLPEIASYNKDFTTDNRLDIKELFEGYVLNLNKAGLDELKQIPYAYGKRNVEGRSIKSRILRSRVGKFGIHLKRAVFALVS